MSLLFAVVLIAGTLSMSLAESPQPVFGDKATTPELAKAKPGETIDSWNVMPATTIAEMILAKKFGQKKPYVGPQNMPDPGLSALTGGEDIGTATVIAGLPFSDIGASTAGFADDYDEVCPYNAPGSPDVVYSYTPAADEFIDITLCGSGYDTKVYVYENSAATQVGCNDDGCPGPSPGSWRSELNAVSLTFGNTYYIVVDGYGGEFGSYDLTIVGYPPPTCQGNDDFASATVIGGLPYSDIGTNAACLDDYVEPCPGTGAGGLDVVYSFSPAADIAVNINMCNGDFDTKLSVYENSVATLVDCDDDACPGLQSEILCLNLTGGNTYYIVVDGFGSSAVGNYELVVDECLIPPCDNDDVASAEVIPGLPYTALGSTLGCTDDYDEVCPFSGSTSPDAIYSYTPAVNETVNFSLCNSDFDTKLYIYENIVTPGSPFACNDDACPGFRSELNCLDLTAGNTYFIVVDGYSGQSGDYELNVETGECGNNTIATATVIPSLPTTILGSTVCCTNDYNEVCPFAVDNAPDRVYSYTPAQDEFINLSLCNSGYDTKFYVYENSVASPVACSDDDCPGFRSEILCLSVTVGNTYYIVVDGYSSASGDFELTIEEDPTPPTISCPPSMSVGSFSDLPDCDPNDATADDDCSLASVTCERSSSGGAGCSETQILVTYTYTATDAAGNTAQCSRVVTVASPDCPTMPVTVGNPDQPITVANGSRITLPVTLSTGEYLISEFTLLLGYDRSVVSLIGVDRGEAIADWEYFTYRLSTDDNCGDGCPSGLVRLVGIADLIGGSASPSEAAFAPDGAIAHPILEVSADQNLIGSDISVALVNLDCSDNVIHEKGGTILVVSESADLEACQAEHPNKLLYQTLTFSTGLIQITAPGSGRGDINLNGIAFEVGDAVLLAGYFTHGQGVLSADPAKRATQIAAADIDNSGSVMVNDLVYLVRILTGEADPEGQFKLSPFAESGTVSYRVENGALNLSTNTTADLGGALFVFRYSDLIIGTPVLSAAASDLTVTSRAHDGELRVLVSTDPNAVRSARVGAGSQALFTVPVEGSGRMDLIESQLSDAEGAAMSVRTAGAPIPTGYALLQNYPNPFNAGTVIPFDLGQGGDWSLQVYNVAGQVVRTFTGHEAPGRVDVSWDGTNASGSNVASGVYFYRVVSGEFAATRKMTLLK